MHRLLQNNPATVALALGCLCACAMLLLRGHRLDSSKSRSDDVSRQQDIKYRTTRLAISLMIGFITTITITNISLSHLGLERIHAASNLIRNFINKIDYKRRQIGLIGSSQTAQGIDGDLLERYLRAHGFDLQIVQLSIPGVFNIESDLVLEQYLSKAPAPPLAILIDMAFDPYHVPAVNSRRDGLPIAASSWMETWQRIRKTWLYYSEEILIVLPDRPNAAAGLIWAFFRETLDSINFFLCYQTNCALLRTLSIGLPDQYDTGHMAISGHAKSLTLDQVSTIPKLTCSDAATPARASLLLSSLSFRGWQAKKYRDKGIPLVGFYYPPNLAEHSVCFQKTFCERIGDYACINLGDARTLTALNSFDVWYDETHVNSSGVPILTEALGRSIVDMLKDTAILRTQSNARERPPLP